MTTVTPAHRRMGLILPPGNPQQISELADLLSSIRFVIRQPGSGIRIWLDSTLERLGIDPHHTQAIRMSAPPILMLRAPLPKGLPTWGWD